MKNCTRKRVEPEEKKTKFKRRPVTGSMGCCSAFNPTPLSAAKWIRNEMIGEAVRLRRYGACLWRVVSVADGVPFPPPPPPFELYCSRITRDWIHSTLTHKWLLYTGHTGWRSYIAQSLARVKIISEETVQALLPRRLLEEETFFAVKIFPPRIDVEFRRFCLLLQKYISGKIVSFANVVTLSPSFASSFGSSMWTRGDVRSKLLRGNILRLFFLALFCLVWCIVFCSVTNCVVSDDCDAFFRWFFSCCWFGVIPGGNRRFEQANAPSLLRPSGLLCFSLWNFSDNGLFPRTAWCRLFAVCLGSGIFGLEYWRITAWYWPASTVQVSSNIFLHENPVKFDTQCRVHKYK